MGKQFTITENTLNGTFLLKIIIDGHLVFNHPYKTEKKAYAELIAISKVHMNLKNAA